MLGIKLDARPFLDRVAKEIGRIDAEEVKALAEAIYRCYEERRFVFVIGNGGSGSSASHFCEDLGKCTLRREDFDNDHKKRLRILSLTDNTPYILAWANDEGFERVFVEQLKNLASTGDLLIAISGSGNSPNILRAVEWANRNGLKTFGCTGFSGGKLRTMAHEGLHVPLDDMGIVESIHLTAFHWIVDNLHARISLGSNQHAEICAWFAMATTVQGPFEVPELVRVLKGIDPTALLVPARLLRRVIKQDRNIGGIGLFVPHRKSYVIGREALLKIADRGELGLAESDSLPPNVILLVRPELDRLARLTRDQALVKYWRMLFHARLDLAMEQKIAVGTLNAETARQRIQRLGVTEFDEITAVMQQEDFLLPPKKTESIYAEFVAVYLTLRRFANRLLPHFFPGLSDFAAVDALIAEDVDVDAIYAATRLPGAPEPDVLPPRVTQSDGLAAVSPESVQAEITAPIGDNTLKRLDAKAQIMDAKGNNVRAAILRTRAAEGADLTLSHARNELARLSKRLQKALDLSDADTEKWRNALLPLLSRSARGFWTQEARFLYDLQKVCVDSERGIYAVDLLEWARSLGRRPIRRRLPGHQQVAIVRHLRQALGRMRNVRLTNGDREALTALLQHAVKQREGLVRDRFRPLVADALAEVGLKPSNVPEEMGRNKLVEELLDRVVDYGHFNIGNLRDAISRNQFKLPDLKSPVELMLGDPLIRLNRKLAVSLDGVYRRGEIYMRLLHRLSSVAFGTASGRLLVLSLLLPFGLAFFVMVTPGLLIEEGEKAAQWVGLMEMPPAEQKGKKHDPDPSIEDLFPGVGQHDWDAQPPLAQVGTDPQLAANKHKDAEAQNKRGGRGRHAFPLPNPWGVAAFGVFFLLLIHVGRFRSSVFYGVGRMGRGLQSVFIHGPLWLIHLPALQALLRNRLFLLLRRFLFWPLMTALTGGLIAWLYDADQPGIIGVAAGSFCLGLVVLNTRLGRDIEETFADLLMHLWLWLTTDFLPGLLRLIMDLSRWCLEAVEQVLYTVNEWLRFRGGESRLAVIAKAVLSLFWSCVTYVLRFAINLLIEPQINPIKHFPVVTVSHKVCIPTLTPPLHDIMVQHFDMENRRAWAMATAIVTGIPGIFGFAVWELKENWKLYRANRSRNLKPVRIGSHGETMLRLLKPGFHSGTLPKLFRRLRRAERHGQQRTARKVHDALHHVAECVGHFVERELLALLQQSEGWQGLPIELGEVHLATNRVAVELHAPSLTLVGQPFQADELVRLENLTYGPLAQGEGKVTSQSLVLSFDHHAGWLVANVLHAGWLDKLTREQRQTLGLALVGLYKMAGIHMTGEQIADLLAPTAVAFDITDDGLLVWPGPAFSQGALYDLSAGPSLEPQPTNGALPPGVFRTLDTERVLFSNVPVSTSDWARTWDRDKKLSNGEQREWAYAVLPK